MNVMPDLLLDLLELDLHLLAELEVERAERLVEKEHPGPIHERARECDALALAAGELARLPALVALQAHHAQRLGQPRLALGTRNLPDHEPVRHVLTDRHVREQGVVLEDGVDVAIERRDAGQLTSVQVDPALGRLLEAGDHAQGRGLSRSRWAEHAEELAVGDLEVDPVHRGDLAEALDDALEAYGGQWGGPLADVLVPEARLDRHTVSRWERGLPTAGRCLRRAARVRCTIRAALSPVSTPIPDEVPISLIDLVRHESMAGGPPKNRNPRR